MKFRLISDLHLEYLVFRRFPEYVLPVIPNEEDSVLLIAGDLGNVDSPKTYIPFLKSVAPRFSAVYLVAGNHEFYNSKFSDGRVSMNSHIRDAGLSQKVKLLEKEAVTIGDVYLIGDTLWTDFDKEDPSSMLRAQQCMNDYRAISYGYDMDEFGISRPLWAKDTLEDHNKAKDYIFGEIDNAKYMNKYPLVMTHHAPSRMSISKGFERSDINGAFVSELSDRMMDADCELTWVHGHVHQNHDYTLSKCHVICNPRGYDDENLSFKEDLVFEL